MRAANLPSLRGFITNGLALRIAVAKAISEVEVYFNRGSANAETDKSLALKTFLAAASAAVVAAEDKAALLIPANTVAPAITGTATQGQTLTVSNGTWTGGGLTYTRQWYRDGVAIAGATATTRLLSADDVGKVMTVVVTATNLRTSRTATSNATAAVAAA